MSCPSAALIRSCRSGQAGRPDPCRADEDRPRLRDAPDTLGGMTYVAADDRYDGHDVQPLPAAAASSCRPSRSGSGTTSASTGRSTAAGRSSGGRSTSASRISTSRTTTGRRTARRRRTSASSTATISRRTATSWSSRRRRATTCGPARTATGGSRKYLLASLDQSLRRMGLDYVDIFYSHRFDPDTPLEETMGALDTAVRQGKALYVGISSYSPDEDARGCGDPARPRHAAPDPPAVLLDAEPLDRGRPPRRARRARRRLHLLLAARAGDAHRQVPERDPAGLAGQRRTRRSRPTC